MNEISGYTHWRIVGNNYYYSWYIATTNAALVNNKAYDSICPTGWQLPNSTSSGDTNKTWTNLLDVAYELNEADATVATDFIKATPLSLTVAGFIAHDSTIYKLGSGGLYWTNYATSGSSQGSTAIAQALDYQDRNSNNSTYLTSNRGGYKKYAFSVRCVKK